MCAPVHCPKVSQLLPFIYLFFELGNCDPMMVGKTEIITFRGRMKNIAQLLIGVIFYMRACVYVCVRTGWQINNNNSKII